MDEIAKRLNLHEFFSHLFPGAVALGLCMAASAALGPDPARAWPASAFQSFAGDSLTVKLIAFLVASYALGLVCLSAGDGIMKFVRRLAPSTRLEMLDPKHDALSASQRAMIRRRVCDLTGLACETGPEHLTDRQVFQLCYAYTIANRLDGFIQVMSGRMAMYTGLAGAFAVGGALWVIANVVNPDLAAAPGLIAGVVALVLLAVVWATTKARHFDHWFCLHVYNTFLMGVGSVGHRPSSVSPNVPPAGTPVR